MRQAGVTERARDLGPQDHLCWVYADRAEFRRRAHEFLLDGLALGQQVWYVAPGPAEALAEDLRGQDDLAEALRRGRARAVPLDPARTLVDPAGQTRVYARATDAAVAAGFTGLRVAADCTSLVGTPARAAALTRFEHLVDQYMASRPFSAMCGYHRAAVSQETAAHVPALHPLDNTGAAGFRLFGSAEHAVTLTGALDLVAWHTFDRVLRGADPQPRDGRLVVDATGLDFLDHHSLLRLAEHACHHTAPLVLRTRWPGAARLVRLLSLPDVRVEEVV